MTSIFVEPHSRVPAHAQIKEQIQFACVHQKLRPGDAIPSIRGLARQLNVGFGVVRRAYRELREGGLLVTANRVHVIGQPAHAAASKTDIVRASTKQCDRLITWARNHQLSAIALSRLLLRQALVREIASPSYLFVDICRLSAETSVARISRAWGIRVVGVSVDDFANLWNDKARHLSAVLVSHYLHDEVIDIAGEGALQVFSVRMRLDERLRRRLSRLPARAAVVLICSDEDFSLAGGAVLGHYEQLFGKELRFDLKKVGDIPDLPSFILAQRYRLFLFCPPVWEKLPARVKRMVRVAPAFGEPDAESLEEIRLAAGVLL